MSDILWNFEIADDYSDIIHRTYVNPKDMEIKDVNRPLTVFYKNSEEGMAAAGINVNFSNMFRTYFFNFKSNKLITHVFFPEELADNAEPETVPLYTVWKCQKQ